MILTIYENHNFYERQSKKYWSKAKKKTLADRTVYNNQPIKNQINNTNKSRLNILQIRKKHYFLRKFKLILRIYKINLFHTLIRNIFVDVKGNDIVQSSC